MHFVSLIPCIDQLNGQLDSMNTRAEDLHNSIEYQLEKSFAYSQMTSAFEETIKFFNSCKCCDRHQCNKLSCLDSEIKYHLRNRGDILELSLNDGLFLVEADQ